MSVGKFDGQSPFCSLVSVFSKLNIVQLNLLHCEFPCGLYGEVMVLSTPYILHKASIIFVVEAFALVTVYA